VVQGGYLSWCVGTRVRPRGSTVLRGQAAGGRKQIMLMSVGLTRDGNGTLFLSTLGCRRQSFLVGVRLVLHSLALLIQRRCWHREALIGASCLYSCIASYHHAR
jgi:hypothetical protein